MKEYESYVNTIIPWTPFMPAHWQEVRGKRLFTSPKERNMENKETNVLSLTLKGVIRNNKEKPIGLSPNDYSTYQIFESDNLVFKLIDLNNISTSRVGIVPERGIMSSAYIRLVARKKLNVRYFYMQYYSMWLKNIFNGLGAGVRQTLSPNDLLNIGIVVPPVEEQDKIVRYIDWKVSSVNSLISNYRREISSLSEMKQRLIDDIVSKGLHGEPLAHIKNHRWEIDYPVHWQIQRIRETFQFRKGLPITKENLEETGIPVINYGQIHSKKNTGVALNNELIRYVNRSYLDRNRSSLVDKGDFIFADTSEDLEGCGNCVYIDREGDIFAGYHSIIAHPNGQMDNKYLAYLFRSSIWRYQLRKRANGVKVYSITQRMLKDSFIFVPPADEQKEIIDYLDRSCSKLDVAIGRIKEKICILQEMKTKIIEDTVFGKIDVRDVEIPKYEFVDEDIDFDSNGEDDVEYTEEQEG